MNSTAPSARITGRITWDRQLVLALIISAIVFIVRGSIIGWAHSPCYDDNFHLSRGLYFLRGDFDSLHQTALNDPPLGEALVAVPAWANGVRMPVLGLNPTPRDDRPPEPSGVFLLPRNIAVETAIWKSILFLPAMIVIFDWVRGIYSLGSAWLAVATMLAEPTLAAHLPLATPDSLGVEGIVLGSWAVWRYVEEPTRSRRLLAAAIVATALLLKHTALVLPGIAIAMAIAHWMIRLRLGQNRIELFRRFRSLLLGAALVPVIMWILLKADFSDPGFGPAGMRWPGGIYLKSLATGLAHAGEGHPALLLGQYSSSGWWYYFPVLATYKIPIGLGIIVLLGIASLVWYRPRYAETPLAICAAISTYSLMRQHIDIGFRHFLVPEIFWIMLASRAAAQCVSSVRWIAWLGLAAAAVETAAWTPNQLSYVNFPRNKIWMQITDSNLDWGQSLWQIQTWLKEHPEEKRPIYIGYFGPTAVRLADLLGPRLSGYATYHGWRVRTADGWEIFTTRMPGHGILIVSPVLVADPYNIGPMFAALRQVEPREWIGAAMMVYDLDAVGNLSQMP